MDPLCLAASDSHFDAVKILLENGAKPSHEAFTIVLKQHNVELVKLCLKRGADPNIILYQHSAVYGNAIMYASRYALSEIVECLLEHGADPNLSVVIATTPFSALYYAYMAYGYENSLKTMEMLLKYGADPNREGDLLHTAAMSGYLRTAELLLKYNADFNKQTNTGQNLLHYFATQSDGFVPMAKLFLERGLDPNVRDTAGLTPFSYLKNKDSKMAKLLISYGAAE